MSELITFRQAIIDSIKAEIPDLDVQAYDGKFHKETLGNISWNAPALLVACLGWSDTKHAIDREAEGQVNFIAYLITDTEDAASDNQSALFLADKLTGFIADNHFGQDVMPPIAPPHAVNLFSGAARDQQINLWALAWQQVVEFGGSRADLLADDGDGSVYEIASYAPVEGDDEPAEGGNDD